jgi:hypothetical protein
MLFLDRTKFKITGPEGPEGENLPEIFPTVS